MTEKNVDWDEIIKTANEILLFYIESEDHGYYFQKQQIESEVCTLHFIHIVMSVIHVKLRNCTQL